MVEYRLAQLDRTFAALADSTRREILARLRAGPFTVGELAEPFNVSLNAISKHLKVLERAGLIRRQVSGREHYCSLDPKPMSEAAGWVEHYREFWEQSLDGLDAYLRNTRTGSKVATETKTALMKTKKGGR